MQDVLRLDVAVDQTLAVSVTQGSGDDGSEYRAVLGAVFVSATQA
jgi:hypothetical protein